MTEEFGESISKSKRIRRIDRGCVRPVDGSETNAVLNKKLGNKKNLAEPARQRRLDAVVEEDLQTVRGTVNAGGACGGLAAVAIEGP